MSRPRAIGFVPCALAAFAAACTDVTVPAGPGPASFRSDPGAKGSLYVMAEQPVTDPGLSPLALYPLDAAPGVYDPFKQNLAQTFTATADASLRYVSLPVACASNVLLHLEVRDGGPGGPVLNAGNYDLGHYFADGTFIEFQMTPPVALAAGSSYALVLSSAPRSGAAETTCSVIRGPAGDSYAGGQGFYNNPGYLPYWIPLPDGAPTSSEDLPFHLLVH